MSKEKKEEKITIDGVDHLLNDLSENALIQLKSIQFVDEKIQQLNNELAVSDTARMGYSNALKVEIEKIKG
jgi:hypothetical protein